MNDICWKTVNSRKQYFSDSNANIYGVVKQTDNGWSWKARVISDYRVTPFGKPLRGSAPSEDRAKLIVETLLRLTDTYPYPEGKM